MKIHDTLQKKLVPKTCKLVPETPNKNKPQLCSGMQNTQTAAAPHNVCK